MSHHEILQMFFFLDESIDKQMDGEMIIKWQQLERSEKK